jgi:hypothetical protein
MEATTCPAAFTAAPSREGLARSYAVPLVVAVTGHRDLVAAEIPAIRARVRECLLGLRNDYPGRLVAVMSALADGADRLVAHLALELGMPLTVVLPMPRALYEADFSAESLAEFAALCNVAADVFELPLIRGNSAQTVSEQGSARALQYASVGVFLCAHCHVLLALWDGKDNGQLGGTGQVVRFHHDDVMPDYAPPTSVSLLSLTDDESDLVYHVVCSRDRAGGEPAPGLTATSSFWFTRDSDNPRSAKMPERHRRVFVHANEFSREAQAFAPVIDRERVSLLAAAPVASLPSGLADIDQAYCAADWLAIRYQKRVALALKAGHVCALFAAAGYLSYTDLYSAPSMIALILLMMLTAVGINWLAVRGAWHRKYLDYRTLAEGLRVQFYWAAAGVTSGNVTKFAHDNCLQMRDVELGWIRNVMRVAGTECDVAPSLTAEGLAFARREWIGDAERGQLGYYRRRSAQRSRDTELTRRIGRIGIVTTLVALFALLFIGPWLVPESRTPIVYLMGIVLLLVGVRQSYASSRAESELIRQYEFMHRIFRNARRRINEADNDAERRRILKLLGDSALEEHAEWILIHRERAIEEESGLRLG